MVELLICAFIVLGSIVGFVCIAAASIPEPSTVSEPAEQEQETRNPVAFAPTGLPGCAEGVDELPASNEHEPSDPRLKTDHLIVVQKSARRVMLFSNGKIRRDRHGGRPSCWQAAFASGNGGDGDKVREGDMRTPEGWFRTSNRPQSQFYGAILIHYPSVKHAKRGLNLGLISQNEYDNIERAEKRGSIPPQDTPLGGLILLHGGGAASDWTLGCIAMNDYDIDELRAALLRGMRVWILILP